MVSETGLNKFQRGLFCDLSPVVLKFKIEAIVLKFEQISKGRFWNLKKIPLRGSFFSNQEPRTVLLVCEFDDKLCTGVRCQQVIQIWSALRRWKEEFGLFGGAR